MPTRFFDKPFMFPALVLGLALFIGLWIVGWGIANRNTNNIISVTGSASQMVKADSAKWTLDVKRTAYENGTAYAYAQVARDAKTVNDFFAAQKLSSSSITQSVITTDENYKYDPTGNAPVSYTVHETVTIQTTDVDKIDALSRNLADLNGRLAGGTVLSPFQPEYYVSSLPQLRVSLLGEAVKDAKARADAIAKSGGSSVGALSSASSGVVQVLSPNSTNIEDYGTYDTSTIQKQVMVTARVTFYVK